MCVICNFKKKWRSETWERVKEVIGRTKVRRHWRGEMKRGDDISILPLLSLRSLFFSKEKQKESGSWWEGRWRRTCKNRGKAYVQKRNPFSVKGSKYPRSEVTFKIQHREAKPKKNLMQWGTPEVSALLKQRQEHH